ncbi:putative nuclease HARBI1 [Anopheles ziemanni]|uniref:putative nuclease HARBI1 n=1 Tax=Anopheles coustani TaxID=139045 RepID=UPI00265901E2|nr:putative nuclease HARBI1 [Anopheles coustani]XP_058177775.1 putative nuclease HARBI1 [Anopheles ziemanni]
MFSGVVFVVNHGCDDDSDEENVMDLVAHQRRLRKEVDPLELPEKTFILNFRVSKALFLELDGLIADSIAPKHNRGLSPRVKLAATLRFLAQGSYQQSVANDFAVPIGQSTFLKVLEQTLNVLESKLAHLISLEMTEDEKSEARRYFFEKMGIPGVVMCVDGSHIKIIPPHEDPVLYYNRKGFYSLNALMICDHSKKIRYVNARFSGSNHDSFIFNNSTCMGFFEDKWRNGERMFKLLGDSAYASKPWLIKPFRNPDPDTPESSFNLKHSRGRSIIEQTFGSLKNRFRCILGARQLHYAPPKCVKIVNVCCALHNLCIRAGLPEIED